MKNNLQYRRTDKAIVAAFIKLVQKKSFDHLTVQDILDEALVSRYTFYAHYHDKYEIAETLQMELFEKFQQLLTRITTKNLNSSSPASNDMHHALLDQQLSIFIEENKGILRAIKNIHCETVDFFGLLQNFFKTHYLQITQKDNARLEAEIYASIISAEMRYYTDVDQQNDINISKPTLDALINATLFSLGIHDKKTKKEAANYLSSLLTN